MAASATATEAAAVRRRAIWRRLHGLVGDSCTTLVRNEATLAVGNEEEVNSAPQSLLQRAAQSRRQRDKEAQRAQEARIHSATTRRLAIETEAMRAVTATREAQVERLRREMSARTAHDAQFVAQVTRSLDRRLTDKSSAAVHGVSGKISGHESLGLDETGARGALAELREARVTLEEQRTTRESVTVRAERELREALARQDDWFEQATARLRQRASGADVICQM